MTSPKTTGMPRTRHSGLRSFVHVPVLIGVTIAAVLLSPVLAAYGAIIGLVLVVAGLILRATGAGAAPVVTAVGLGLLLGSLVYFGVWAIGANAAGNA